MTEPTAQQSPEPTGSKDSTQAKATPGKGQADAEALLHGFPPRDGEDPVQKELLKRLGEDRREQQERTTPPLR